MNAKLFLLALQFLTRIPLKHIDPLAGRLVAAISEIFAAGRRLDRYLHGRRHFDLVAHLPMACAVIIGLAFRHSADGRLHEDGLPTPSTPSAPEQAANAVSKS